MSGYSITFKASALKEFRRLPRSVMQRFAEALGHLEKGPPRKRAKADVKRLHGLQNAWRLRVGDYRGIFSVHGKKTIFTRFAHRSKVYDV